MHRVEVDLSFKEISEVQDTSINTALGRMRYARKNLLLGLIDKFPKGELYRIVHTNPRMREFVQGYPEIEQALAESR